MDEYTMNVAESEKEQEVAEPAQEGEKEQEAAEPVTSEPEQMGESAQETPTGQSSGQSTEQSVEQRRQNAALRRQREQNARQAEFQAMERAAQARIDAAYAKAYEGRSNPYTGKPITSEKEYKEYMEQYRSEMAKEQLNNAGLSADVINTFIENHPAVKRAEDVLQEAEMAKEEAQRALAQEGFTNEMKLISALDPSIKTADDLANMENVDKFNSLIQSGVSLSDAFKIANFEKLIQKNSAAVKTSALNSAAGRSHLSSTNVDGGHTKTIPPETLAMYRELNPGLSDSEYQKHYEKMNKE